MLTTSARDAAIQAYTRKIAPVGNAAVSVLVEDVPFADLAAWLVALDQRQGVEIERISIASAATPGLVSAQMTLKARTAGGG